MTEHKSSIVFDVDGTLCPIKKPDGSYSDLDPFPDMVKALRQYKEKGFHIVLFTARNMKTYKGNVGAINANTAPQLISWLEKHDIPYDEIYYGKPWPGPNGFYVDDKAIRPDELLKLSHEQILKLINE